MKKKLTLNQFLLTCIYKIMDEHDCDSIQDPVEGTHIELNTGIYVEVIYITKPVITSPEIGVYVFELYDGDNDGDLRSFDAEELATDDLEYLLELIFKDFMPKKSYGLWLLEMAKSYKELL